MMPPRLSGGGDGSAACAVPLIIVGRALRRARDGRFDLSEVLRVEVERGRIARVSPVLATGQPQAGEHIVGAPDAVLLPALSDSHVHLVASAAARAGTDLSTLHPSSIAGLCAALRAASGTAGDMDSWLRVSGFDESRLAERRMPTLAELDAAVPQRPLRLRHATRHASLLNSTARARLEGIGSPLSIERAAHGSGVRRGALVVGLEPELTRLVGPLERDALLRGLAAVSDELLAGGVVVCDEMTASNDATRVALLADAVRGGIVKQRVRVFVRAAEVADEARAAADGAVEIAGVKLLPRSAEEVQAPAFAAQLAAARRSALPIAVHAVEVDVAAAVVAALRAAPRRAPATGPGAASSAAPDRIEHASLCPPGVVREIAAAGIAVVSQPGFVVERGDKYRAEVEEALWPWLYPLRSLREAGVLVAAGSDAPVAGLDPRTGLRGATARRTAAGHPLGAEQVLDDAAALALYTTAAASLRGETPAEDWLAIGAPAEIGVLDADPRAAQWRRWTVLELVTRGRHLALAAGTASRYEAARGSAP